MILISFIGVFLLGLFMVLIAKDKMCITWRDGIDIPRAKKDFLVWGWIVMVLGVIAVTINFIF